MSGDLLSRPMQPRPYMCAFRTRYFMHIEGRLDETAWLSAQLDFVASTVDAWYGEEKQPRPRDTSGWMMRTFVHVICLLVSSYADIALVAASRDWAAIGLRSVHHGTSYARAPIATSWRLLVCAPE
jgi:hypothetical protein